MYLKITSTKWRIFFQNPTVLSVQLKLTRMHICLTVWIRLLNFVCAADEYLNLYVPLISLSLGSNSKPNILHVNGINMVTHGVASWHGLHCWSVVREKPSALLVHREGIHQSLVESSLVRTLVFSLLLVPTNYWINNLLVICNAVTLKWCPCNSHHICQG